MSNVITCLAVVVAAGWLPVLAKFFSAWRSRKNPISLAICGVIAFCIYIDAAVVLFLNAGIEWTVAVLVGLNAIGCLHFYLSFWWARKRFGDERS